MRVVSDATGTLTITLDGSTHRARVLGLTEGAMEGQMRLELDGVQCSAVVVQRGAQVHLAWRGQTWVFEEVSPLPHSDAVADPRRAQSPVAGKVTQVRVTPGMAVEAGTQLLCVEAMKMEMWLCAHAAGTVQAVRVREGEQVAQGAVLVELDIPS